jgi:hypothetical protein
LEGKLEDAEELFEYGQDLTTEMTIGLHGDYRTRLSRAIAISNVEVCAIRVRPHSENNETFHILSECFIYVHGKEDPDLPSEVPTRSYQKAGNKFGTENKKAKLRKFPFFTIAYEHLLNDQKFDVSLSFTSKDYSFMTQPVGCFNCSDEKFCSQQTSEEEEWNFDDSSGEVVDIMEMFTSMWTPILADFAQSFGTEYMYDEVAYIVNQVYDSWDDIPRELESSYEDYKVHQNGELKKDSKLCSKDDCSDSADRGGLCYSHEDLCRAHDCFDYKSTGAYCDFHSED